MQEQTKLLRTRIISINDFYTRLQLEYLSYRLRYEIYQRPFDKKKFMDICIKKREKIEQIAFRNCLPSIFNNDNSRNKYISRFFKEKGLPNFCYRDEYQSIVKGYWDAYYYFVTGANVKFTKTDSSCGEGTIESCDVKNQQVYIMISGRVIKKNFNEVTREFPEGFIQNLFL